MKIGYLSIDDPSSKRLWSGTVFYMAEALERQGHEVTRIGPMPSWLGFLPKAWQVLRRKLTGKNHLTFMNAPLSRVAGWWFGRQDLDRFDLLFVPAGSSIIAHLKTRVPIFYATDTTFRQVKDYYDWYSDLHASAVAQAEAIEAAALAKAKWVGFSSQWSVDFAAREYGTERSKMGVASYGANLDEVPTREEAIGAHGSEGPCKLLFLGRGWERKGGAITLETFRLLRARGVDARLTFCGTVPPVDLGDNPDITVIPFLDKNDPEQQRALYRLILESNFLVLPTRADCTPIVFSEAAAFGLPVVTTDTGGVAAVIRDGENGFALPLAAGPAAYAETIQRIWTQRESYRTLVESSRRAYDERLNWDTWGERTLRAITGQ